MSSPFHQKLNKIKDSITKALQEVNNPIAAFDADGTLWPIDMGETFFDYQIKNQLVKDLTKDPWQDYQNLRKEIPQKAYLWLAQINKGYPLETVRSWAHEALQNADNFSIFDEQKEIIDFLHEQNVAVYVVTASVKWAVEPAAEKFNIPAERVIGIETKTEQGLVTDIQAGPITYREGKVEALLEKTNQQKPFFVSGNTMGDFKLLESSSHIKLSITSAPEGDSNYETEQIIYKHSLENNWFNLNYLLK